MVAITGLKKLKIIISKKLKNRGKKFEMKISEKQKNEGNQCSGALVVDKKVSLGHKSDIAILCSRSDKSQQFKHFKQFKLNIFVMCPNF